MFDRRVAPMRRWVAMTVLVVLASGLLAWAITNLSGSVGSNCQQLELLKSSIRATLISSEKTLGRPGTAGYEYYRAHPAELADALSADRAAIANFAPKQC